MKKLFVLFLFLSAFSNAQFLKISDDSLHALIASGKTADTLRCIALSDACYRLRLNDPDSAGKAGETALSLGEKIKFPKGIGAAYNNLALILRIKGNYEKSIESTLKAIRYLDESGQKTHVAKAYSNLGATYMMKGTEVKNKIDFDLAEKYVRKAYDMFSEMNDRTGIMGSMINLAAVYFESGQNEKALTENQQALEMAKKLENTAAIGLIYNNLGNVYARVKNSEEALNNYLEALKIREASGQKQSIALTLGNIAGEYGKMGKQKLCIDYAKKALALAKELEALDLQKEAYSHLTMALEDLGQYKEALEYYHLYTQTKDSLVNEENSKRIYELEAVYQNERKEKEIQLKNSELEKKEIENKHTSTQRNIFLFAFAIMFVLSVVIFRTYVQKKKAHRLLAEQKKEIEKQKAVIEEKNTEIIDSITYAQRIQRSLLPTETYLQRFLGNRKLPKN